ncbi:hypothetical protein ACQE6F_27980, partial [Klebsiella pneumoniae]
PEGGHSPSGRSTGAEKQKACSKAGFLNLAPLTGIAFTSNWLIIKLILNYPFVKTTRVTTN